MKSNDILDAPTTNAFGSNIRLLLLVETIFIFLIVLAANRRFLTPSAPILLSSLFWYTGSTGLVLFNIISPFIKRPRPDVHWLWAGIYGLGCLLCFTGMILKALQKVGANEALMIGFLLILLAHLLLAVYAGFNSKMNARVKFFFLLLFFTMTFFSFGTVCRIMSWPGAHVSLLIAAILAILTLMLIYLNNNSFRQEYLLSYIPRLLAAALLCGLALI